MSTQYTACIAELSVGLFSSTQPYPTHQITDPTQPIPNRTPLHRTTTVLP